MVDASSVRASVVTSDGCLATWVDESISPHCSEVLNVPATVYDSIRHESIVKLNVCSMFSAVLCKSSWFHLKIILDINKIKRSICSFIVCLK